MTRFEHVVVAIEEAHDLSAMTVDELSGTLQAHEQQQYANTNQRNNGSHGKGRGRGGYYSNNRGRGVYNNNHRGRGNQHNDKKRLDSAHQQNPNYRGRGCGCG
ncbi:hypothetical protein Patl1_26217 [Pistacia atlantica]|uniref:Uncharacterized protein n=1 Tax=Pistacia atlantica TaxID=434234 RepID=A0ACC1B325_9ROSI|nr:hypothetical protein Patl1_26217 [Pistacia atlantica]